MELPHAEQHKDNQEFGIELVVMEMIMLHHYVTHHGIVRYQFIVEHVVI